MPWPYWTKPHLGTVIVWTRIKKSITEKVGWILNNKKKKYAIDQHHPIITVIRNKLFKLLYLKRVRIDV